MKVRYVEWVDSVGGADWQRLRSMPHAADRCRSIGFVVSESDDHLTLVQSHAPRDDERDDMGDNYITIPKVAITRWFDFPEISERQA